MLGDNSIASADALHVDAATWQITALPNAPNSNTYLMNNVARSGNLASLMSAYPCLYGYGSGVTTAFQVVTPPEQAAHIVHEYSSHVRLHI